jgi:hypothetical protein
MRWLPASIITTITENTSSTTMKPVIVTAVSVGKCAAMTGRLEERALVLQRFREAYPASSYPWCPGALEDAPT